MFEFPNQNELRQFIPVILQHDCTPASGFRLIDPFYQWAYFKNINPTMYPVMAGDGMRPTDLWLSKAMPREVRHQLKRNLEVYYNKVTLI